MRLKRSSKRTMASDDGLIPMINIVFLLLVFFMVAGAIRPVEPLDITPPESARTGDQNATHVVHLAMDGSLAFDGRVVSEPEFEQAVSRLLASNELAERDDDESTASNTLTQRPILALRADGQVTFERLRKVINVLKEVGVSDVELLTTWVPSASASD